MRQPKANGEREARTGCAPSTRSHTALINFVSIRVLSWFPNPLANENRSPRNPRHQRPRTRLRRQCNPPTRPRSRPHRRRHGGKTSAGDARHHARRDPTRRLRATDGSRLLRCANVRGGAALRRQARSRRQDRRHHLARRWRRDGDRDCGDACTADRLSETHGVDAGQRQHRALRRHQGHRDVPQHRRCRGTQPHLPHDLLPGSRCDLRHGRSEN